MMLDNIKADETYEKIKRQTMDREFWRNWMTRSYFQEKRQVRQIVRFEYGF